MPGHAAGCVIVLDLRRQAYVLCLAIDAPERPTGLRVFPEHKRRLEDNTAGRRLGPGKPCVPLSTDAKASFETETYSWISETPAS